MLISRFVRKCSAKIDLQTFPIATKNDVFQETFFVNTDINMNELCALKIIFFQIL